MDKISPRIPLLLAMLHDSSINSKGNLSVSDRR